MKKSNKLYLIGIFLIIISMISILLITYNKLYIDKDTMIKQDVNNAKPQLNDENETIKTLPIPETIKNNLFHQYINGVDLNLKEWKPDNNINDVGLLSINNLLFEPIDKSQNFILGYDPILNKNVYITNDVYETIIKPLNTILIDQLENEILTKITYTYENENDLAPQYIQIQLYTINDDGLTINWNFVIYNSNIDNQVDYNTLKIIE